MGEGVAKEVGVQILYACLPAPTAKELRDAGGGHAPLATDPEPFQIGMGVAGTDAQVLVDRLAGPVAERQGALAAAPADHEHHVVLEVHIAQAHATDLRASAAGVEQQQDQGAVAAGLEVPAGAGGVGTRLGGLR
jgi:hypothetical protein